uniref:Steroid 5 alpha-reductase 1 n=1 Tax=Suricata suricatta TaxID=37032 RepID=A0A673TB38_SURSU
VVLEELVLLDDLGVPAFPALRNEIGLDSGPGEPPRAVPQASGAGRRTGARPELPSLAVPLWVCTRTAAERLRHAPNRVLLAMFLVHYAQRSLIFPFLIRGGKTMPLYTCVLAFMFCTYNGYLQSRYLSQYAVYADGWVTDPRFLAGCCMWLLGMLVNIHSDHILRNLRKPGETGYKIPRGTYPPILPFQRPHRQPILSLKTTKVVGYVFF